MNGRQRFALTFAAAYAVAYYVAVYYNLALFSYGPAVGEWTLFNRPASAGPTMFWYGWLATAAIIATLVGLLAACYRSARPVGSGRRSHGWCPCVRSLQSPIFCMIT